MEVRSAVSVCTVVLRLSAGDALLALIGWDVDSAWLL